MCQCSWGRSGCTIPALKSRVLQADPTTGSFANGGWSASACYNGGSGGATRVVAPVISGNRRSRVNGGASIGGQPMFRSNDAPAGPGRIRVDTLDPALAFNLALQPVQVATVGSFMNVFPVPVPGLDFVHAAGQDIAEGEPEPVVVQLPLGSPTTQTVTVRARNFVGIVPIRIVATPEHGWRVVVDTEIDMTNVALGDPGQISVDIDLPINTPTRIHAWTRE